MPVTTSHEEHRYSSPPANQVELCLVVALQRARQRLTAAGDAVGVSEISATLTSTGHADLETKPTGIKRGPGLCLDCKCRQGEPHFANCYFAPFVTGQAA